MRLTQVYKYMPETSAFTASVSGCRRTNVTAHIAQSAVSCAFLHGNIERTIEFVWMEFLLTTENVNFLFFVAIRLKYRRAC